MFNFWDEYKNGVAQAAYIYTSYTLAFSTVHVLSVRFGFKESCDVFGNFGIENFVMFSLTFLLVNPFIKTYFTMEKSQRDNTAHYEGV